MEDQFWAAVRIMKSLPRDGPFQPSKDMTLRLQSCYMQSQFGPCDQEPPSFWEWSKRLQYNAWKALGNMSRGEAMKCYTDDLKKIIETMSFNSDVAGFLRTCGPFYEFVDEDSSESSSHGDCDKLTYNIVNNDECLDQEFSLEDWNGDYETESSSESSEDVFVDSLNYVDSSCKQLESCHTSIAPNDLITKPPLDCKGPQEEELKDWTPTSEVGSMSPDATCEKSEVALFRVSEDVKLLTQHLYQVEKKMDGIFLVLEDMKKNKAAEEWKPGLCPPMCYLLILTMPLLIPFVISVSKRLR